MIVLSSFEAVQPLPLATQYLQTNIAATQRLRQIIDTKAEVIDPAIPFPLPNKIDLELLNLSFTYPGQKDVAMKNVSLSIPYGKKMALVGASGAGKSTLVNLLLRFWEFQEGEILLDGKDLRLYAQDDVRRIFSVISQKTDLYNDTVRDNLLIARPDATQAEIEFSCQQAQILEFIQSLPKGFETIIGEAGLRLSGGERQRLAIARALLKNAPVLILDEASANLDLITEKQVLQAIQTLMAGRTVLMITHRLVEMENMDEIVVLRSGRIAEHGSHQELIQRGGLYAQMVALQVQNMN
jgi:ATP-binding cassette subfamily C protein CydC